MVIDFKNYFIEIYLSYNVVLVSGLQQSGSGIYTYVFFQIVVPYRLL